MNRLQVCLTLACVTAFSSFAFPQSSYNIYFGDTHSHTWYSDGNQDQTPSTYTLPVARSITWARSNRSSMDFLGISDHNHNEGGLKMTLPYWRSGFREADSVNQEGTFVGLYGEEWGVISGGGHVLVYGTDKLFGWNTGIYDVYVPKSNYALLWDSVKKYNGYCYLAHPNQSDFGGIFTGPYNAKADSVVRGVAVRSGPASSTNTAETNPSSSNYESRYHDLLRLGYHAAPIENQDSHNTTFGRANQQRTGVLAASLTKVNIDNAFRYRHVYATDDHNLQVRFDVGSHVMGDIFTMSGEIPIRVKAYDPDGEAISHIEIRYGVPGSGSAPTTLQSVNNSDSLVFSRGQAIGTTYYYYAYITEADGHAAWTAPMWITITANPAPSPFAMVSPANGSASQPVNGTLRWSPASGAASYDVYLGINNPPSAIVSAGQTDTSYTFTSLNNAATYYWKIVAKNAGGNTDATGSPWSFTTIQMPPGAFTRSAPLNGATGQPVSGTLSWQASPNATGYDVYLDQNYPPVSKVSSAQAGTTFSYTGLINNNTYYWNIIAKNAIDSVAATGAAWNFTTIIAPPSAFSFVSPVNGSMNQPVTGNLKWRASPGAASYDVYLDTANPPLTLVSSGQIDTTWPATGLANGTVYYWKIVAKNNGGSVTGTGSPWSFSTIPLPPAPFGQISPSDSAVNQPVSGTLSWQASTGATGYDVYLGTVTPPATKVSSNQPATSYAYSSLSASTTYYWLIVARNSADTAIAAGSPWSFTTSIPPPAAFTLIAPATGAISVPVTGTLVWHRSPGASSYDVYLGTSNPPSVKVSPDQPDTTFLYGPLANDSAYYWKVVAKNTGGVREAGGSPWNFTTVQLPPEPFLQSTPANGATDQPASGTLIWQPSPYATQYDVYLDRNNPPRTKVDSGRPETMFNYILPGLSETYYWKIVARNAVDSVVATGAPWNFTTVTASPESFILLSPPEGAVAQPVDGTILLWRASRFATSYDIFLDQSNPPVTKADSALADTSYLCHGLAPGVTYYWKVVAKNSGGSLAATNAPSGFSTEAIPAAPDGVTTIQSESAAIGIGWLDRATNESGYRIYRSTDSGGPFVQTGADLPPNTQNALDTGLSANVRYYYRIVAFNHLGESIPVSLTAVTQARTPGRPAISAVTFRSAVCILDPANNPPSTEFAVSVYLEDSFAGYLGVDGNIGPEPSWQTYGGWGGSTGTALNRLLSCSQYSFSVRARNQENIETPDGSLILQSIPCFSSDQYYQRGWNLISLPIAADNALVADAFPTGGVTAFSYDGRYVPVQTLQTGYGYWLKFTAGDSVHLAGAPIETDTVPLRPGWNIIGSGSTPVSASSIIQVPDGIVSSNFFGFNGTAYTREEILEPMKGYWVKARNSGSLIISSVFSMAKQGVPSRTVLAAGHLGELVFEDSRGRRQSLTLDPSSTDQQSILSLEYPPSPPEGIFDIRFASQRVTEQIPFRPGTEFRMPVTIRNAGYPVAVRWRIEDGSHRYRCTVGSAEFIMKGTGSFTLRDSGEYVVLYAGDPARADIPVKLAVAQNYPNPFNPSTTIRFGLPSPATVSVTVSSVLGETVGTLIDHRTLPAGWQEISWNGTNSSSGIYYFRITADRTDGGGSETSVRRMILLK